MVRRCQAQDAHGLLSWLRLWLGALDQRQPETFGALWQVEPLPPLRWAPSESGRLLCGGEVLRQATLAELQANSPEMVKVLQKAWRRAVSRRFEAFRVVSSGSEGILGDFWEAVANLMIVQTRLDSMALSKAFALAGSRGCRKRISWGLAGVDLHLLGRS